MSPRRPLDWVPAFVLGALCACSAAGNADPQPGSAPSPESARISGRVLLAGPPPKRLRHALDAEMQAACRQDVYEDELWLVSPEGGLANCVLTLEPTDGRVLDPAPPPLDALYEKVGPRYEPRVLAVPLGTRVIFRNRDSPCRGFVHSSARAQFSWMLPEGSERSYTFEKAGPVKLDCPLRAYMRGAIYVAASRWSTTTGADGSFELRGVPPGAWRVRIWHEALGYVKGIESIEVVRGEALRMEYTIPSP